MNELIELIYKDFKVDNKLIPVSFLKYIGSEETYIIYHNLNIDGILCCDDEVLGYVDYYDFDIYSKSNYLNIIKEIKKIMKENGFMWIPSMSSEDLKEDDTGYYHKTLCFAKERMEV